MIVGIIVLVVLVVLALIFYSTLHKAPSCVDGIQNQGEQGIDCGGPCPYLCTALEQAPVVRFTQALPNANGTYDIIAYVDNPNRSAYTRGIAYQISLYAPDHTLGAPVIAGSLDLPPGASLPIFIPNVVAGKSGITSAFLMLDPTAIKWQAGADTRIVPTAASATLGGSASAPRVITELDNPSALPISNVRVVVTVFDASGNVIAASQTVVPSIAGQGSAVATFTWNAPFPAPPARIEVLPVIPLAGS